MRQIIIASHAHFAPGLNEAVEFLSGPHAHVRAIPCFVDGNDDVEALAREAVDAAAADGDVIVCTDLFGGSVNNEFTKLVQTRTNVHLVANMNLPLLLQLVFAEEGQATAELLRELAASDDCRVKYVNDLVAEQADDEEDF